jgi:hypothetical protein
MLMVFAGEHSGQRGFIVVGPNFNYGEDITSRGHIKVGPRCLNFKAVLRIRIRDPVFF